MLSDTLVYPKKINNQRGLRFIYRFLFHLYYFFETAI